MAEMGYNKHSGRRARDSVGYPTWAGLWTDIVSSVAIEADLKLLLRGVAHLKQRTISRLEIDRTRLAIQACPIGFHPTELQDEIAALCDVALVRKAPGGAGVAGVRP